MLCERCEQEVASVHVTKIINNQKTEAHFCQKCAKEVGGFGFGIEIPNIFSSFFEQPKIWGNTLKVSSYSHVLSVDDFGSASN